MQKVMVADDYVRAWLARVKSRSVHVGEIFTTVEAMGKVS